MDRKQWELAQMLVTQGRFSMNVENIDVNVEVLPPNAKKALTAEIAKYVVQNFMAQRVPQVKPWAQPLIVHPVAPRHSPPPHCTSSGTQGMAPNCMSSGTQGTALHVGTGPTKTAMGKCLACTKATSTGCNTSSLTGPYTATIL